MYGCMKMLTFIDGPLVLNVLEMFSILRFCMLNDHKTFLRQTHIYVYEITLYMHIGEVFTDKRNISMVSIR